MCLFVFLDTHPHPCNRGEDLAQGSIVIEDIDDQCDVFAHIAVVIIRTAKQIRCLIDQIRCDHTVDYSLCICLIKGIQTSGKESESCDSKDAFCLSVLELTRYIEHAFT